MTWAERVDLTTGRLVEAPEARYELVMPVGDPPADAGKSAMLAWNPRQQMVVWSAPTPRLWNGGTTIPHGGLVLQG